MLGNYLMSYSFVMKAYCSGDSYEEVGRCEVILTDEKWAENDEPMILADRIRQDFNDKRNWNETTIYEYLEDTLRCTNYTHGKIARIAKFEIKKEYRSRGYFSLYFEKTIDILKKWSTDYIAVMPERFGEMGNSEDANESRKRLQNFYEKFGFTLCSNEGVPYMVKKI